MPIYRHVWDKKRFDEPDLIERASSYGNLYFEELHAGHVVSLFDRYVGDGESVYGAIIWDPSTNEFDEVVFADDRGPRGPVAVIDAPAHVLQAWENELERRRLERRRVYTENERLRREEKEAEYKRTPRRGSVVRIVRGRKVPIGIVGTVFWVGDSQWGPRAGIESIERGREFIAMANIEVLSQPN